MSDPTASEYERLSAVLTPMGPKIEILISDLLKAAGLNFHAVNHRVKQSQSATRKIANSAGKYGSLTDLHDMLGVRVITYLASDVDKAVTILRANFEVDGSRSVDKQEDLDPNQFGYRSYHLVLRLDESRSGLAEWAPYKDIWFEVQVRSLLQHTWAEIEHDLGYKSESGIPSHLRRDFARLAGLLETADGEFDRVSREIADHVDRVTRVIEEGGDAPIDRDSIRALVTSDGPVRRADLAIADAVNMPLGDHMPRKIADARAKELASVGFKSTGEVVAAVRANYAGLVAFAGNWLNSEDSQVEGPEELPAGISVFYLYLHERLLGDERDVLLTNIGGLGDPDTFEKFLYVHDAAFGIAQA